MVSFIGVDRYCRVLVATKRLTAVFLYLFFAFFCFVRQATCEVHPVLRETFCCKAGHGVGPKKNDVPELLK